MVNTTLFAIYTNIRLVRRSHTEVSIFLFQVRLIKEVSVSLMGNPNLMDPLNETRSTLLGCSFDVAEKDPEFILKVIIDITINYV